jgi:hypothetical protein
VIRLCGKGSRYLVEGPPKAKLIDGNILQFNVIFVQHAIEKANRYATGGRVLNCLPQTVG